MKEDEAAFQELRRLDAKDMLASVVAAARRYLAKHPARGLGWFLYSESLRRQARYSEALQALRRASRLCPASKMHLVYIRRATLHRQRGAIRVAERWFRRAADSLPQDASYHILLGGLLASSGRLQEAEAVHRRATRCKEGCIDEAWLNLGLVLRARERFREARTCFRRAIALDPKYRDAWRALADVEYAIGESGRARVRDRRRNGKPR
ncbi:MAG TPA: tetratricopeptide repeat protein [Planctomycetota bacterium]